MKRLDHAGSGIATVLGTAALTLVFAAIVAFARLPVRDGSGTIRTMRVLDVWLALLDHLPPEAPAWLSRGPLTVALLVSMVALAYALVATLQLRDS